MLRQPHRRRDKRMAYAHPTRAPALPLTPPTERRRLPPDPNALLGGRWHAMTVKSIFPAVVDEARVGSYPALAKAGGGYVWDAVLEYRVWCHPERGAPDESGGEDYFRAFASFEEAESFAKVTPGAEEPLALILQEEHIDEPEPGKFVHVRGRRIAEWPPVFLSRPRRSPSTIPDFISPTAPANRLDILRGIAPKWAP